MKNPSHEASTSVEDILTPVSMSRREVFKRAGIAVAGMAALGSVPIAVYNLDSKCCLRFKAVRNLFRMGHCAPTVARTLLDTTFRHTEPAIKAAGAMAGGIGGLGAKCGGLTSSALFLCAQFNDLKLSASQLEMMTLGKILIDRFKQKNESLFCRDINGTGGMRGCLKAIRTSQVLIHTIYSDLRNHPSAVSNKGKMAAWQCMLSDFDDNRFHCSHCVFNLLGDEIDKDPILMNATRGFIGGLFFSGLSCNALSAGVMAIGLKIGEIENDYFLVLKMMRMMAANDSRAMDDTVNGFNKSINTANRLVKWFENTYGATSCLHITRTDFSRKDSVDHFRARQGLTRCVEICEAVADEARRIMH